MNLPSLNVHVFCDAVMHEFMLCNELKFCIVAVKLVSLPVLSGFIKNISVRGRIVLGI